MVVDAKWGIMITLLKSKLHRATVTGCHLDYDGSITIDELLMEQAHLLPYEQVDVLNISNGARFTTYVITGDSGSGQILINGAAARLVQKNDLVIICSFIQLSMTEAQSHKPTIILLDHHNRNRHG